MQRIGVITLIAALVVVPVLVFLASDPGSEYAYEVPRMLGMENEEYEVARLDGPPTTDVSAPIYEIHGQPESLDKDLRDLPKNGPKEKKPAREMGTPPNMGPNGNGVDPVLQTDVAPLAVAPDPLGSFKGLDLQNLWRRLPPRYAWWC